MSVTFVVPVTTCLTCNNSEEGRFIVTCSLKGGTFVMVEKGKGEQLLFMVGRAGSSCYYTLPIGSRGRGKWGGLGEGQGSAGKMGGREREKRLDEMRHSSSPRCLSRPKNHTTYQNKATWREPRI